MGPLHSLLLLQVRLEGIPLLRLRADPAQGNPDPRFFQTIRGLMNVTSPTAGEQSATGWVPQLRGWCRRPPISPHACRATHRSGLWLACDPQAHDLFVDVGE